MSDIGGGGNGGFDQLFLQLEWASLAFWMVIAVAARFACKPTVVIFCYAALFELVLPVFWNIAYHSHDGLEGAGRVLFGAPFLLAHGLLSVFMTTVVASPNRQRKKEDLASPRSMARTRICAMTALLAGAGLCFFITL